MVNVCELASQDEQSNTSVVAAQDTPDTANQYQVSNIIANLCSAL